MRRQAVRGLRLLLGSRHSAVSNGVVSTDNSNDTRYYCLSELSRNVRLAYAETRVIRLRLAEVLRQRNWTPYRLAQETGLTVPTAYRLADPGLELGRITVDTLDRLCAALKLQPGDLLEWIPESGPRRRIVRTRARGN
jgi:putative transcriptional regulator